MYYNFTREWREIWSIALSQGKEYPRLIPLSVVHNPLFPNHSAHVLRGQRWCSVYPMLGVFFVFDPSYERRETSSVGSRGCQVVVTWQLQQPGSIYLQCCNSSAPNFPLTFYWCIRCCLSQCLPKKRIQYKHCATSTRFPTDGRKEDWTHLEQETTTLKGPPIYNQSGRNQR